MEICVQVFLWTYVFICLRHIPTSGTVSQMVTMFNFLRCSHTVLHFTFPLVLHTCSGFLHILAKNCCFWLFDYSHPSECEVAFHCGCPLHFPDDCWTFFMCLLAMCTFSLEKCLLKYFTHLKIVTVFIFVFLSYESKKDSCLY